ncbi:MAG TPA: PDZ domain-containing protein [Candidatus Sulfotelmatobacter sp.]|nr:PDZ domain-containing protein [Candidatus Sulfotelmatobacter sp.]
MNAKAIFMTLGLGALTVGLVALPGESARKPQSAELAVQNSAQEQMAQAGQKIAELQDQLQGLAVNRDGDDDMRVFVNTGGSWLGAGVTEVTPDKMKEFKLPAERGVVLGKIVPDSPAAKAGLKANDVVTEIDGQRVEGTEQFRRMIREIPAGRTAQFKVWRDGRAQNINVTIGKSEMRHGSTLIAPAEPGSFAFQIPQMPEIRGMFENGPWTMNRTRLGIDAEELNGEFGNYFGAPDGEGILVRGVFPDSPAAKAGLKVGDVITSVNGERIRSVGELRAKMAEQSQDKTTLKLGLIRNKAPLTVTVELPAPQREKEISGGIRTTI